VVRRTSTPNGAPIWIDVMTSDPEATHAFYSTLFGWTVVDPGPDYGGYVNFHLDGEPVAGCMKNAPEMQVPDLWSVYLAVEDPKATTDAAAEHGGAVIVPPMDVLELGTMAVVADAGGAAVGMWKPNTFNGVNVLVEPGAPQWFELFTRDFQASLAYYRDVFGWDVHVVSDTPEFRYATLFGDEQAAAGIMDASGFLPEGVPAHWSVYFNVADADATLKRIVELGGQVVVPAEDTPFGRLATASDPTGAMFKLCQP
jgi:predicted enzyme related to lactoylglutathione lyase